MRARLARALVAACKAVHASGLLSRIPNDALIQVRIGGEEHPLVLLPGVDDQGSGLLVLRGPQAFGWLQQACEEGWSERLSQQWDCLVAAMEPWGALSAQRRKFLQDLGYQGRREHLVPAFQAQRSRAVGHLPGARDGEVLLACLNALLVAEERGELTAEAFDERPHPMLSLEVEGSPFEPLVTSRWMPLPMVVSLRAIPLDAEDEDSGFRDGSFLLPIFENTLGRDVTILDSVWWAGWVRVLLAESGFSFEALAVLRLEDSFLLACKPMCGEEDWAGAFEGLIEAAEQAFAPDGRGKGLPRELRFGGEDLAEVFGYELESLRVEVVSNAPQPAELEALLKAHGEGPGREVELGLVPRTDDLEGWSRANLRFQRWRLGSIDIKGCASALEQFFGTAAAAERAGIRESSSPARWAFLEWLLVDYRETEGAESQREEILARPDLEPIDHILLEARERARLSLYRVTLCEPGSFIELECIPTGTSFQVYEPELEDRPLVGAVLPLRLIRAGDCLLPLFAGPFLDAEDAQRFLCELEAAGCALDPDSLRSQSHLLGRLWLEVLEREPAEPADAFAVPTPIPPTPAHILEYFARLTETTHIEVLDKTRPELGNRTPRELCKTAAGRAEVERWIRDLPPIITSHGDQEPPRDLMRRELGLDEASLVP